MGPNAEELLAHILPCSCVFRDKDGSLLWIPELRGEEAPLYWECAFGLLGAGKTKRGQDCLSCFCSFSKCLGAMFWDSILGKPEDLGNLFVILEIILKL